MVKKRKQKPRIVVSENLKSELNKMGEKNDSYENIIWKMVRVVKRLRRKLR